MSRRILLVVTVLLTSLVVVSPASAAAPISFSYCEYSGTGGGSLAPDNDIQIRRNALQGAGYNIVSSYKAHNGTQTSGNVAQTTIRWRFVTSSFQVIDRWLNCHRWDGDGVYHDGTTNF